MYLLGKNCSDFRYKYKHKAKKNLSLLSHSVPFLSLTFRSSSLITLTVFHAADCDFDFYLPYCSFDYENAGYQAADLIKMDILLNGRPVEELITIVHR